MVCEYRPQTTSRLIQWFLQDSHHIVTILFNLPADVSLSLPFPGLGLRLIHGSLCSPKSTLQLLHGLPMCPTDRQTHELCLMVQKSLLGHMLCISDVLTSVLDMHCLLRCQVTSLCHRPVDESVTWLSLSLHHEHGTGCRQSLNCCSWPLLFVTNWRQFCSSLPMDTGKQTDDCFVIHPRSPNKKVKVAHTRLPSVGFWSWSQFLAVSLQVTWVINPAVGFHYFPPGPQLPS